MDVYLGALVTGKPASGKCLKFVVLDRGASTVDRSDQGCVRFDSHLKCSCVGYCGVLKKCGLDLQRRYTISAGGHYIIFAAQIGDGTVRGHGPEVSGQRPMAVGSVTGAGVLRRAQIFQHQAGIAGGNCDHSGLVIGHGIARRVQDRNAPPGLGIAGGPGRGGTGRRTRQEGGTF